MHPFDADNPNVVAEGFMSLLTKLDANTARRFAVAIRTALLRDTSGAEVAVTLGALTVVSASTIT